VSVSLIEALLNRIVAVAVTQAEKEEDCASSGSDPFSGSAWSFSSLLESTFAVMDRDGDAQLTTRDFAAGDDTLSYAELRHKVDPQLLYAKNNDKTGFENHEEASSAIHDIQSTEITSLSHARNTSDSPAKKVKSVTMGSSSSIPDGQASLSSPIRLRKTDSLWTSVSNEKSLPSASSADHAFSRSYTSLEDAAAHELYSLVDRASSILDDSRSTAVALLVHFQWNLTALVDSYLENSRSVRLAVGLAPRHLPPFLRFDLFSQQESNASITVTCGICQDSVSGAEAFALTACLHWFCADCWRGFVESSVRGRQVTYRCPFPECRSLVVQDLQNHFCDATTCEEARNVLIRSFVEEKRGKQIVAAYCKNPRGCAGVVLLADDADYSEAYCTLCNTTFCAACDLPPHAPATCEMVKFFLI
jgi:hypothetical protein